MKHLHNKLSYSVYVRVWYTTDTYAIFRSNGIYVITEAPTVTNKRGKAVS